jgi:hypothetical protein
MIFNGPATDNGAAAGYVAQFIQKPCKAPRARMVCFYIVEAKRRLGRLAVGALPPVVPDYRLALPAISRRCSLALRGRRSFCLSSCRGCDAARLLRSSIQRLFRSIVCAVVSIDTRRPSGRNFVSRVPTAPSSSISFSRSYSSILASKPVSKFTWGAMISLRLVTILTIRPISQKRD